MAQVAFVRSSIEANTFAYQWTTMANGDDGEPISHMGKADRSVQVNGTFGVGGSIRIQGSNMASPATDADWFDLTDASDNPLVFTTAKGETILQLTRWVRADVTAGDGTTDLDVYLVFGGR